LHRQYNYKSFFTHLSSIFNAFVREYHIVAVSVKRVEDPCQQSSTALSNSARIRTLRQAGRRPLSSIFDALVGDCYY